MSQMHLLRTRRFLPLFITQVLSVFHHYLLKTVLIIQCIRWFGWESLNIVLVTLCVSGVFILPLILFSATAGQLADAREKSQLIRWAKFVEMFMMAFVAFEFVTAPDPLLLAITLCLLGILAAVVNAATYAMLPQHLSDSEVVGGNAFVQAGTFIAILLGTFFGTILMYAESNWLRAVISLGLLLLAVVSYLSSRLIPQATSVAPHLKVDWLPIRSTLGIMKLARKNYGVFLSAMTIGWFWFYVAAFLVLLPLYTRWAEVDEMVTVVILATFSIGIAIGSLLCGAMSRKRLELGLVPFGSLGMSCFAADLYFAMGPSSVLRPWDNIFMHSSGQRILFDLFCLATFSGFFVVPLYTYIQLRSEPSERSRMIAASNVISALFIVASSLALAGFFKAGLKTPQIFFVLACMNAVIAIYVYLYIPEFLLRFYAWCIAHIMYRMKIRGHENIPTTGPAVLVCNHVTFVDWLIIAAGVRRPLRFVIDHSFYVGFLRTLLNQGKVIPIASAKENPEILAQAFERMKKELEDGELVCIFPEGRLTGDGNMNYFRPGIERLISETPVPVVPMALRNVWGSYFSRKGGAAIKKLPRRFWSAISLEIGKPVPPEQVTAAGLQILVQELLDKPG